MVARNAFIPALFGLFSVALAVSGIFWCTLLEISPRSDLPNILKSKLANAKFGLFSQQKIDVQGIYLDGDSVNVVYRNICVDYPSSTSRDTKWTAAIGLQIGSAALAAILSTILMVSSCRDSTPVSPRVVGAAFILLCATAGGLVFLVLDSNLCTDNPSLGEIFGGRALYEDSCSIGGASYLIIVSATLYCLAGLLSCFCVEDEDSEGDYAQEPTGPTVVKEVNEAPEDPADEEN